MAGKVKRAFERKSFRRLAAGKERPSGRASATHTGLTHNVYVVELDPIVGRWRRAQAANPLRNPALPCIYVGMSGLAPEQRFANHKEGIKSASVVKKFGIRLLPALYAHLNPMPYENAAEMERELALDLRRAGYTVFGGY